MLTPSTVSNKYQIGVAEFLPIHEFHPDAEKSGYRFPKEIIRRIGLAIRTSINPGETLVKFLDQLIDDKSLAGEVFTPGYYNKSIFRGVTGILLAELPDEYLHKLQRQLVAEDPMLAMRSAGVLTTLYSTVSGFPDFQTYLHCFFKCEAITSPQILGRLDRRLKACSNRTSISAEVQQIRQDLSKVAEAVRPQIGQIQNRRMQDLESFEARMAEITKALDRKEEKYSLLLSKNGKNQQAITATSKPKPIICSDILVSEKLPTRPAADLPLPDFMSFARNADLLLEVYPKDRQVCATNFIQSLTARNIPLDTQIKLLIHLQILSSWDEINHVSAVKYFFEKNNNSHKTLGIYYLVSLPEDQLLVTLQQLAKEDHLKGDFKRRIDLGVLKLTIPLFLANPKYTQTLTEEKIDLIAQKLRLGIIPSYVPDFWK